jgi:hypothetical protein
VYRIASILMASFVFSGLIAGKTSFASEVSSLDGNKTSASPGESGQESQALRHFAVTLADNTWGSFHDATDPEQTKHSADLGIPGMNCSIDDIANYVSCYSPAFSKKEVAQDRFIGFINDLQAVLPPERWSGAESQARVASIRSYTYDDRDTGAQIDIDIIPQWSPDEEPSYGVAIFGWAAAGPQL